MTEYQDLLKKLEHEETREIMEYIHAVHTQLPVIALGLPHTLKSSVDCVLFEYLSLWDQYGISMNVFLRLQYNWMNDVCWVKPSQVPVLFYLTKLKPKSILVRRISF